MNLAKSCQSNQQPAQAAFSRLSKIVCTIGPATCETSQIRLLLESGVNVFRLNFSHSDHPWHTDVLQRIRSQAEELSLPVAVMQDLCGPKIRLSRVVSENYHVTEGDIVHVTTEHHLDNRSSNDPKIEFDVATTYAALLDDVEIGDTMLVSDGRIAMIVEEKHPEKLVARITRGGHIQPGKGLNLPGVTLSTASVTSKDWKDVEWGIENDIDFIALSFVRHPDDLIQLRAHLDEAGSNAHLIAKIERPEAIFHIEQIIDLADGLMVARGDLGLETDLARVPLLQKHLIQRCRDSAKPVITATQMLDSMVQSSIPTRAEVSDVANAIIDGSDAIMLSDETAIGKYPLEAVEVLNRVAEVTETDFAQKALSVITSRYAHTQVGAITEAAAASAIDLKASRVVVYSQTGYTARMMARYRLPMPVVAVTNIPATYRQLCLSYGVFPVLLPEIIELPQLLSEMDQLVVDQQWGKPGDTLVVVSALDGRDGNIDTLHFHRVEG